MPVQFQRAERRAVKLKLAVQGPAGSGKTMSALALARNLVGPAGRIAVIDTENESASLYAEKFEFDVVNLSAPFTTERYLEAVTAAVTAQPPFDVLVIDSLSHAWAASGGILDRKESKDAKGGNSFANWATFSKEHTGFVAALMATPLLMIVCMRSKAEYVIEENSRGKQEPKKVGMAAVQREGIDFEFSVVFEIGMNHLARGTKDRTDLFADRDVNLMDPAVGKSIIDWLKSAKAEAHPRIRTLEAANAYIMPLPSKTWKGKPLSEMPDNSLRSAAAYAAASPEAGTTLLPLIDALALVLADRERKAEAETARTDAYATAAEQIDKAAAELGVDGPPAAATDPSQLTASDVGPNKGMRGIQNDEGHSLEELAAASGVVQRAQDDAIDRADLERDAVARGELTPEGIKLVPMVTHPGDSGPSAGGPIPGLDDMPRPAQPRHEYTEEEADRILAFTGRDPRIDEDPQDWNDPPTGGMDGPDGDGVDPRDVGSAPTDAEVNAQFNAARDEGIRQLRSDEPRKSDDPQPSLLPPDAGKPKGRNRKSSNPMDHGH